MFDKEAEFAAEKGLLDSFRYGSEMFFNVCKHAKSLDLNWSELDREILDSDIGEFDHYTEGDRTELVPLDFPMMELGESLEDVQKAEYRGRDVGLNKPEKNTSGSGKFRVFVRDPKTGNIKKITFGASVTRAALEDKDRRDSFSARHDCPNQNDKTTAAYWACSTSRWFHKVMGGEPIGARYW